MNTSRFSLAAFFVGALLLPGMLFAVETPPPAIQAVLVATVNISNALVTAQTENVVNVSFNITNGTGVQPGVKYAVFLTKIEEGRKVVVDENVYDETLTLGVDTNVHKDIVYTAPKQLSGIYDLWISSKNNEGLPLASILVGKVQFEENAEGAVFIDPSSCFLTVTGEAKQRRYNLYQGVDIAPTETLEAHCTVQNTTKAPVTLTPSFVTRLRNAYGAVVPATGGGVTQITLLPNEHKSFTLALPKAATPQSYDVLLTLTEEVNAITSNAVKFHYVIQGASATIQNALWEKNDYQKGDTAVVSFVWSPSADSFINSRSGVGTPLVSPSLVLSMTDERGAPCGEKITTPLSVDSSDPILKVEFPVTEACLHPIINAIIQDTTHGVLTTGRFVTSTVTPATPASSSSQSENSFMIAIVVLSILASIGGAAFYFKRKGSVPPAAPGMMIALFVIVSGVFGDVSIVEANTWYSQGVPLLDSSGNPNGYYHGRTAYTVNLDKGSDYLPGERVDVTTGISSAYCDNAEYDQNVTFKVDNSGTSISVFSGTLVGGDIVGPFADNVNAPLVPALHNLNFTAILTNGRYSDYDHDFTPDVNDLLIDCYNPPYDNFADPSLCISGGVDLSGVTRAGAGYSGGMNGQTTIFAVPFTVTAAPLPPPPVVTVTQAPSPSVLSGTTGTISWTTDVPVTSCSLYQDGVLYASGRSSPGSSSRVLSVNTTFTVTCFNAGGQGSDSVSFTVTIPPPVLGVVPTNVGFGDVAVTDIKDSTEMNPTWITVRNVGPAGSVLYVSGITPSAHFSCVQNCTPILSSGASQVVTLRLTAPATTGSLSEVVRVNSDGGNQNVTVNANIIPAISIMPGPLNFGDVIVGKYVEKTLSIINNSKTLTVPAGTISVAPPFYCASSCAYLAIPPRSTQTIVIRYKPAAVVRSNDTATLSTSIQDNTGDMIGNGLPQKFKVIEQ